MALNGYRKDTKMQQRGDQNTSKNKDRKKGSVPSANGRGGRGAHPDFWNTFGATWSIRALEFGAHLISEGRSVGRFSMYLALREKVEKHIFANNSTAKVDKPK